MSDCFAESEDLPPFDEDASCPMCTRSRLFIQMIYHSGRTDGFPCDTRGLGLVSKHLCRICERCCYGWCQAVAKDGED